VKRKGLPLSGWIILDKPAGMTSTQALGKVRWLLNAAKGGHGGTLDPMATGVLPLAFGEATKTISWIMDASKEYTFTARWGESRSSDDAEGQVTGQCDKRPSREEILAALPAFQGAILQKPPSVSALKIDGQRAYDLVREGEIVDLAPREVRIDSFTLEEIISPDEAVFRVKCGKGTYMRALARDMGIAMGTLGHITALRRHKVGPFLIKNAISLDKLSEKAQIERLDQLLLPLETALCDIPVLAVTDAEAARLRFGQRVSLLATHDRPRLMALSDAVRQGQQELVVMLNDKAIALGEVSAGELRVVRLLNH
jgi:tRNA pseudouridine55 synthase